MLIREVDSKITDFADVQNLSAKDVVRKRVASLLNKNYRKEIFLDKKNILRQKRKICTDPSCRSTNIKKNGYHPSNSFIIKEIGLDIYIGQHECLDCGSRWSVDVSELYQLVEKFKEQTRELAVHIRAKKNSLNSTSDIIELLIGRKYSYESIRRWFKERTKDLKEEKVRDEDCSGYYVYDEQEVSAGGKKMMRLTLKDVTIKEAIFEEILDDKKKETIRNFLVKHLRNKPRIALTVDGDTNYPDIITKDLGMNYQLDIGHLFSNIRKIFKQECGYGVGHKKLHLMDELKKQELYDVFYPRKELISFVKSGLKKLDKIKDRNLKEEKDIELQKELLKLKKERKKKRRRKDHIHEHKGHTLRKAKNKFDSVKQLKNFYPKKIQKWISKIEEDWSHYTLFLTDTNVPPTSNRIEQHFSSTLQRSEKKKFRNITTLKETLKIERLKKSDLFTNLISTLGLNFIEITALFLNTFLNT